MLELNFENLLKQFIYIDPAIQQKYTEQRNNIRTSTLPVSFDFMWETVLQIIETMIPGQLPFVESWKADVFMSIYSALSYCLTTPTTSYALIEKISETPKITQSYESIKTLYYRSNKELRNNYLLWTSPQHNSSYFSNAYGPNASLKVFHPVDYYIYLTNHSKLPFSLETQNGTPLHQWYKNALQIYDDLHLYNDNFSAVNLQFRFYVFEQLLSPIRFTTVLSSFWNLYSKHFSDKNTSFREHAILYTTAICNVPATSIETIAQELSPIIEQMLKTNKNTEANIQTQYNLHNQIFQFLSLPYIYFPLCKILLAKMMNDLYSAYHKKDSLKYLLDALSQYMKENIELFHYEENIKRAFQTFKNLCYPLTNSPTPDTELRNNVAISTFGYNFTYNFYRQDNETSCFEYIDYLFNLPPISQKKTAMPSAREILFRKYQKLNCRIQETSNRKTQNYLQAMNSDVLI